MASNSASCKTWCVTIVSALFALAIDKNKPDAILVGLLPLGLFFLLDAYYLSLERDFRQIYNSFVTKLLTNKASDIDLYLLKPAGSGLKHRTWSLISTIFSLSIIPFYGILATALLVTKRMVSH
jgi:hypothetical protein